MKRLWNDRYNVKFKQSEEASEYENSKIACSCGYKYSPQTVAHCGTTRRSIVGKPNSSTAQEVSSGLDLFPGSDIQSSHADLGVPKSHAHEDLPRLILPCNR